MADRLTAAQIAQVAYQAGFRGEALVTMVAIAFPESGGRPSAHNPNSRTGDNSYGLWQINMLGAMGPARRKAFGIDSNEQLFDPLTNAKAAYEIYRTQGFKAWSAYKNGLHKRYLDEARKAVTNLDPNAKAPQGEGEVRPQDEDAPDLEENEIDESILNLPTQDEIRELYIELLGREPSSEEVDELLGKSMKENVDILLNDEEALDFSLYRGATGIRNKFSGS